jgi:hypothetical protein
MFPSWSYVTVPKDMIFGVHWTDVSNQNSQSRLNHCRIDLDLSLVAENEKFGWDAMYRSGDGDIMFSGDMTSAPAPNGATELFYIKKQKAITALVL